MYDTYWQGIVFDVGYENISKVSVIWNNIRIGNVQVGTQKCVYVFITFMWWVLSNPIVCYRIVASDEWSAVNIYERTREICIFYQIYYENKCWLKWRLCFNFRAKYIPMEFMIGIGNGRPISFRQKSPACPV